MTYQEIYNFIKDKSYFKNHRRVLIAVSGGIDSMTLLQFLHHFKEQLQIDIGIAHINHKQRPESDDEEAYLRLWAKEQSIPIYVAYFEGEFSEKAARDCRYRFFKETMQAHHYSAVVTAHHADDQAETVLMRLIRGSRLRHLAAMKEVQEFANGQLIRPFLTINKSDFPKTFHFEDSSNESFRYFRNRVRHQLLPELSRENPQIKQAFSDLSKESQLLFEALNDLTSTIDTTCLDDFLSQTRSVQYFLLQQYLEEFSHLNIKKTQFDTLLHIIRSQKQGIYPLKNQHVLVIGSDSFKVTKIIPKTESTSSKIVLEYDSQTHYQKCSFVFAQTPLKKHYDLTIPLYSNSPITLRHRQAGDSIYLGKFSKKLRRLFIDEKIPLLDRQYAIVGEQDGQVIFVMIGDKTYLRKASKHDIMLAKLYIEKLEKR